MKRILLPALLLLVSFFSHAQVGSLDPSFGKNGIQLLSSDTNLLAESTIKILPRQGSGFFVVMNGRREGSSNAFIGSYTADGHVDTSFGIDGFSVPVNSIATDATLQADGKIVMVGGYVVRYNTDGTLDTTFSGDGIQIPNTLPTAVGLQGDKIVLGGHSNGGQFIAVRYLPDGSLDGSFGVGGIATTNFPELTYEARTTGLLIQDDKIVVAGSFQGQFVVLTRFNNDGTTDNTLNAAGTTPGLLIKDLGFRTGDGAITNQGDKIVVAGSSTDEFIVARFNYDGSLDNEFSTDGMAVTAFTGAVANDVIQSGNKIVIGGSAGAGFAVARFNDDGSVDNSFSGDGKLVNDFPDADSARGISIAFQGNQIIMAGQSYWYDVSDQKNQQDLAVAQYNSDGNPNNNFSEDGMIIAHLPFSSGEFYNAAVQGDGKIIAVGFLGPPTIVRFNKDGSIDSTFDSDGIQVVDMDFAASVRMQGDKIVVAGYNRTTTDDGAEVSSLVVTRFNSDGSKDNSFDADGKVTFDLGPLYYTQLLPNALAIQDDKIIVVGTIATTNGYTGNYEGEEALLTVRFNSDGSLDQGFSQDGVQTIESGSYAVGTAVAMQGNKIVVAGYGEGNTIIARFNDDGSFDPAFTYVSPGRGQSVDIPEIIRIENDTIIVAGITVVAGIISGPPNHRVAIGHYNNDGSRDTNFDGDGIAHSAVIPEDIVQTSFSFDDSGKLYVATRPFRGNDTIYRINQDGTMDSSFKIVVPFLVGNTIVNGNRLYVLGRFTSPELFHNTFWTYNKAAIAAYILEDNTTISITCPPAKSVSTDPKKCTALVTDIDPVFSPAGSTAAINYTVTGATIATGTGTASGSTFNKGVTTVTYTLASDASITCSFTVTVQDNEPPAIACPADILVETTSPNGEVVNFATPVAGDNCNSVSVIQIEGPSSGSVFPIGTTKVTFKATDAAQNTSTCSFNITVVEKSCSTPPTFTLDVKNASCNGAATGSIIITASGGTGSYNYSIDNGETYSSSNNFSGLSTGKYQVVVESNGCVTPATEVVITASTSDPLKITCAEPLVRPTTGGCMAVGIETGTPLTSGGCAPITITSSHPGSDFPVGATTITWEAKDASGQTATCQQVITVLDQTPPTLTCPANIVVQPTSLGGTRVSFSSPAVTDNCPGSTLTQIAGPSSGSLFPIGVTKISFKATDASGNTATCSFTITVSDPYCSGNGNNRKVYICHKGKTTCVNVNALQAHLGHGDQLGQCAANYTKPSAQPVVPGISVYPNPTKGQFTVQLNNIKGSDASLLILDATGRVIQTRSITKASLQSTIPVTLGKTAAGIYVVRLVSNGETFNTKIVVE